MIVISLMHYLSRFRSFLSDIVLGYTGTILIVGVLRVEFIAGKSVIRIDKVIIERRPLASSYHPNISPQAIDLTKSLYFHPKPFTSTSKPPKMPSHPLRVAILECDTGLPKALAKYKRYGAISSALLESGAEAAGLRKGVLDISIWDVVNEAGVFPKLEDVDGVFLTGSSM